MNTRRYREEPGALAHRPDDSTVYIGSVRQKLRDNHVKVETIIEKCRAIDANGDNIIHADDLVDVLFDLVPRNTFSKRELYYLIAALTHEKRKGNIQYLKLDEVIEGPPKPRTRNDDREERWLDENTVTGDERWAMQRGTVGEWLLTAGCTAERQNFRTLISCLEQYERESGLKISEQGNGFVIPLGPDLKASLNFFMPRS
jgi:hypothetical protein